MKITEMPLKAGGRNPSHDGRKLETLDHRPEWITVHGETTGGMTAREMADAVLRGNVLSTYHYIVGAGGVFHLARDDEVTWHAGDGEHGEGNVKSLSVLVVGKAENKAAELIRELLKRYGLGADRVVPHRRWRPDRNCPAQILPHWEAFLRRIGVSRKS